MPHRLLLSNLPVSALSSTNYSTLGTEKARRLLCLDGLMRPRHLAPSCLQLVVVNRLSFVSGKCEPPLTPA